jgi:hypothetical protein
MGQRFTGVSGLLIVVHLDVSAMQRLTNEVMWELTSSFRRSTADVCRYCPKRYRFAHVLSSTSPLFPLQP